MLIKKRLLFAERRSKKFTHSTRPKAEFSDLFKRKPFLDAVLSIVFQMENYG